MWEEVSLVSFLTKALISSWGLLSHDLITSSGLISKYHHIGDWSFNIWIWGDTIQSTASHKAVGICWAIKICHTTSQVSDTVGLGISQPCVFWESFPGDSEATAVILHFPTPMNSCVGSWRMTWSPCYLSSWFAHVLLMSSHGEERSSRWCGRRSLFCLFL